MKINEMKMKVIITTVGNPDEINKELKEFSEFISNPHTQKELQRSGEINSNDEWDFLDFVISVG